ncbi:hypothetical protein AUP68_04616 [Ilyonectria robusta]
MALPYKHCGTSSTRLACEADRATSAKQLQSWSMGPSKTSSSRRSLVVKPPPACKLCGKELISSTYEYCSNCAIVRTTGKVVRLCILCGRDGVLANFSFCAECALSSNESEQSGDTGKSLKSRVDSYLMPPPPLPPHVSRPNTPASQPAPRSPTPRSSTLPKTSLDFGTSNLSLMPPPPLPPNVDTSASPDSMRTLNSPSLAHATLPPRTSASYGFPISALIHGTPSSSESSDTATPYGTSGLDGSTGTALPYGASASYGSSSSAYPYGASDPLGIYNNAPPHGTSSSLGASGSALPYGSSGSYGAPSTAPHATLSSDARASGLTDLEIAYITSSTPD